MFESIARLAAHDPSRPAVRDDRGALSYAGLAARIAHTAAQLPARLRTVAVAGRPGASWIVADLAATLRGARVVPVPCFFSRAQVRHLLADAAVDRVLCCDGLAAGVSECGRPTMVVDAHDGDDGGVAGARLAPYRGGAERVIYTSGTTGTPKGVVHGDRQLAHAIAAIAQAVSASEDDCHLCALPPSLLLEQIAGVFIPLSRGACVQAGAGAVEAALRGDTTPLERAFTAHRPSTTVLVPQLLAALTASLRAGTWSPPASLRLVAVGGAPVPLALVREARGHGLPVFRGYGLSECASVVAVERPDQTWEDTADLCGAPLPGIEATVHDGELVVSGPTVMHGYLNAGPLPGPVWRTGDAATVDGDGRIRVHGRLDRVLVLPSGRNLHPEWVEGLLLADPRVCAARVRLGEDGRLEAQCRLHPGAAGGPGGSPDAAVRAAIETMLQDLPGYARPERLDLCDGPGAATRPVTLDRMSTVPCAGTDTRREELTLQHHGFHAELLERTAKARREFMSISIIDAALERGAPRELYLRYLEQAWHHVRHTCPLLGAALSRCTADDEVYRDALLEYLEEERGHEAWILADIADLGGDVQAVRHGQPGDAVRVMVGYAYHVVERVSPYALLGMVHVLEGVSAAIAQRAAGAIRKALGAGGGGFSYLESHGALDQEHVAFFQRLVDGIESGAHREAIVDTARIMYRLYGDVFRELERPAAAERHAA